MLRKYHLLLYFIFCIKCYPQTAILDLALKHPDSEIQEVLKNKEKHEIQILLTKIKRTPTEEIFFEEEDFQIDERRYFYPASTVKLPIAILVLQKLNILKSQGVIINGDTPFFISTKEGDTIIQRDTTHNKGKLTLHHLIKKIFLVSDNDAYNYLFDFLGRDYINKELKKRGLNNTQVYHKFLLGADNLNTWEYTFLDKDQNILYHQSSLHAELELKPNKLKGVLKGKGYNSLDVLVSKPMNFEKKNRISIRNLQGILQRIIFPDIFSNQEQFDLTDEDYKFLRKWMSRTTLESNNPNYKNAEYWDSFGKFLIYGDQKGAMIPEIRIYNKVGYAYGTLTDVAYIRDENNNIEFFLTATILVNENMIFNDDIYEFEQIGIPFLGALGRAVLEEIRVK